MRYDANRHSIYLKTMYVCDNSFFYADPPSKLDYQIVFSFFFVAPGDSKFIKFSTLNFQEWKYMCLSHEFEKQDLRV